MPQKDPEKQRIYDRAYHQRPESKAKNAQRARIRRLDPAVRKAQREAKLKSSYGLALGEFNKILIRQGGRCASCGEADWPGWGPVVDHDHITGIVRGILCTRCNTAAGMLLNDPARCLFLAKYLGGKT